MAIQFFASTDNLVQWRGRFWADPSNLPIAQPGLYLIQHIKNGKCYVGISQNLYKRALDHWTLHGSPRKLANALNKHKHDAFVFVPLYYSKSGTNGLVDLEAELIKEFQSFGTGGYNTKLSDGRVGPYGPEFAATLRMALANPAYRARRSASRRTYLADPAIRTAIAVKMRTARANADKNGPWMTNLRAALQKPCSSETRAKNRRGS